jgi:hypothetical protein
MGKFLQDTIQLESIANKPGIYKTLSELTYVSNKNKTYKISSGYITDGYSKPQLTQSLIKGRFEDDARPAILHDYACQYHKELNLTFKQANGLLYESMRSVGISYWKCISYYIAVFFNPKKW